MKSRGYPSETEKIRLLGDRLELLSERSGDSKNPEARIESGGMYRNLANSKKRKHTEEEEDVDDVDQDAMPKSVISASRLRAYI